MFILSLFVVIILIPYEKLILLRFKNMCMCIVSSTSYYVHVLYMFIQGLDWALDLAQIVVVSNYKS